MYINCLSMCYFRRRVRPEPANTPSRDHCESVSSDKRTTVFIEWPTSYRNTAQCERGTQSKWKFESITHNNQYGEPCSFTSEFDITFTTPSNASTTGASE